MCAIFGYNSSNVNAKDFHRLLIHRGPDYQKNLNFLNFTVGHNLLAIRDQVENSIQPIETENQRFIFSFNGQIYNNEYLKKKFNLRKDIILDTEVVVAVINKINLDFIKSYTWEMLTSKPGLLAAWVIKKYINPYKGPLARPSFGELPKKPAKPYWNPY